MACTPQAALQGITYDCANIIGGIKSLYVGYKKGAATIGGFEGLGSVVIERDYTAADYGTIDVSAASADPNGTTFYEVEFNTKDGVSVFTDVVTIAADGTKEVVPTIMVEVPLMSVSNMQALADMSQAGVELVALVGTAAGTYHLVGADFGLYAASIDGTSGTGRSEKNRYQLTLTGSEGELAYQFLSEADFNTMAAL